MVKGFEIERFEAVENFIGKMKSFDENSIECTTHTLFRLSEGQRKVFSCEVLKDFLLHQSPILVCVQKNQNYAAYYSHREQSAIKIIISFKPTFIRIITFIIADRSSIPRR